MKKAKKKGKSYSQGWFERQSRRFMSVLLCSSMLSTSVANTAAFAAATSEGGDERQEFSLEKEDLRQAIRDAAKKGKTVKEDAFTFSGDEAETYEGLFEEGNLYELHPDFEKKNDRLTLKMYARLEDEDDMDQYTISGNEEIIFLMTNSSSKERTGRILVDGRASAWMTVAPFGEVKKQVGLETEEAVPVEIENEVKEPESAVPAGSEDITEEDTALEDDVKEQENASDTGNNQIKEETSDPEKQDKAEQKAQEPNTGDSEDTSDIKEEPEAADDKKDLSELDSENENEKADMDASETDTSDANTSDADTSGADTSDADTSDSENDSAQDEDSVQVSRSAHFSMFLTSAAMASPSDAKEEENENDENEKNKAIVGDEAEEDNFERILGDSYETVGIKNASAAAFVTSAMELGLTDVAVLSAVEVEEIPHWQISKSKKATNLDENFESQVTLSLPSAEEKLENDIVFVLDKSTSVQLENEALEMLKELQAQAKENGAKVKVGVVIFNKEAHKSDFMDLETQYDAIEAAIRENISSGTNLSAGILAGKKMLESELTEDTINSEEFAAAFKTAANLDQANGSEHTTDDNGNLMAEFNTNGKAGVLFNGVWNASGIDASLTDAIEPALFPGNIAIASAGGGLAVANNMSDEKTELALEFIKYMTSAEVQEKIFTGVQANPCNTTVDLNALAEESDDAATRKLAQACSQVNEADTVVIDMNYTWGSDVDKAIINALMECAVSGTDIDARFAALQTELIALVA